MREILFRGKHIHALPQNEHLDGTWVYGYLCDVNYINTVDEDEYGGKFTSEMLVDPETVCQYTGLTDKNGRKIFEGDIAKVWCRETEWTAMVEFGNPNGKYDWGWQLVPIIKCDANTDILLWVDMEETGAFCEVIGNIFDNPELKRKEESNHDRTMYGY